MLFVMALSTTQASGCEVLVVIFFLLILVPRLRGNEGGTPVDLALFRASSVCLAPLRDLHQLVILRRL